MIEKNRRRIWLISMIASIDQDVAIIVTAAISLDVIKCSFRLTYIYAIDVGS